MSVSFSDTGTAVITATLETNSAGEVLVVLTDDAAPTPQEITPILFRLVAGRLNGMGLLQIPGNLFAYKASSEGVPQIMDVAGEIAEPLETLVSEGGEAAYLRDPDSSRTLVIYLSAADDSKSAYIQAAVIGTPADAREPQVLTWFNVAQLGFHADHSVQAFTADDAPGEYCIYSGTIGATLTTATA